MIHACMNRTLHGDNYIHAFWLELVAGVPQPSWRTASYKSWRRFHKPQDMAFKFTWCSKDIKNFCKGRNPLVRWRCPHKPLNSRWKGGSLHLQTTEENVSETRFISITYGRTWKKYRNKVETKTRTILVEPWWKGTTYSKYRTVLVFLCFLSAIISN